MLVQESLVIKSKLDRSVYYSVACSWSFETGPTLRSIGMKNSVCYYVVTQQYLKCNLTQLNIFSYVHSL